MAASSSNSTRLIDGFISLQDICKLHILFNLDLFPDYSICQLPRSIRNRLFRSLPIFDRLHYENAQFLSDLDIEDICPSPEDEYDRRVLHGSSDDIKKKLVSCLFSSPNLMKEGCGLNLPEASNFVDCLPSSFTGQHQTLIDDRFNFMKQYCCTVFMNPNRVLMHHITSSPLEQTYFVVPTRLMAFLSANRTEYGLLHMKMNVTNLQLFISYCNLHTVPLRQTATLSINTIELLDSPIWGEYNTIRKSAIEKHQSSSSTGVPIVNPISPLLQSILASVEHLSIGTSEEFEPSTYDEEELSIDAPNFILTNIVSREKPLLKSIHVHGIARSVIDTVATVGAFLCGVEDCPVPGINNRYTPEDWLEYSLVPPSKSCNIESLRITAESGGRDYVRQYLLASFSAVICDIAKRILEHQKATLKSLALTGLGYTYESLETSNERLDSSSLNFEDLQIVNCDEYRSLLNTTLVDFVQLSQFESLELGDSPDTECYPLILAFMTTPASHEQKLDISLRPDSKPTIPDWCEQYPIPTALPHSNIQFKSLVLNGTERSELVKRLFGFPDLSLRFLQFSTVILEGKVPSTGVVNIESLVIQVDSKIIDASKLNVFISENSVLKHLTISHTPYGYYDSSIFSVVNECLLRMVKKQMSLDSITLQEIQLSKHIQRETYEMRERRLNHQYSAQGLGVQPSSFTGSDEEGYDFTKWMPSPQEEVDLGTWFASLPDGSDNIPTEVLDKNFFLFLCLVQKLNAMLTIIPGHEYGFQPEYLEYNLIPSLEKSFKKSNVKIRKIIVNSDCKKFEQSFMRIASTVETID